ncbi:MAG: hypothetical protein V4584_17705 [Verrucomicrobiota bacterium]
MSATLLVLAGFLLGDFCGHRMALIREPSSRSGRVPGKQPEAAHGGDRGHPSSAAEKHDLRSLLRWHLQQESGGPELRDEIGRMDSAAIRDLMTGLVANQKEDPVDVSDILNAAAKELFHREGVKALEWADRLDAASGRPAILEQVIIAAAGGSPEFARPWIVRYHAEFGKNMFNVFSAAAIAGATARGADDLIRLHELYGNDLSDRRFPDGPLPDGFDFQLLMSELPHVYGVQQAVEYWAAKDRDAAWAGAKEAIGRDRIFGGSFLGSVFTGIAATDGDQKAARWIAAKLDEIPPDRRDRAISCLLTGQLTQNAAYEAVLAELPRDSDRVALVASLVSPGPHGNSATGLGALRALGSEALQAEALVGSAKVYSRMASDPQQRESQQIRDYFSNTMDQLGLSAASRERVDAVLSTPQDPYPN